MKVGIVIARYRRTGGLERVAREWATGLRARGHDVTVFSQAVEQHDESITYRRVGGFESPGWLRAATFPKAAARALAAFPVEVACSFGAAVYAPTVMGTAGPHRAWWEQGREESPVTSKEGLRRRLNPHHRVVLAVERRIARSGLFDRVLATSKRAAGDWSRLYGIPCDVLENGVNLTEFSFDATARERLRTAWGAQGRLVVLSIANEVSRKGIDTLIHSFASVRASIPKALLVIGGPAGGAHARTLARAAGVEEHVRTIGPVAEPSACYSAADVFAFPTRYDPWGLVAAESLACGTTVVCSGVAGVADWIQDGVTGVLLDEPRSPDALAAAIVRAFSIPSDRAACRAAVEPLSWERILDRVEVILDDVVKAKKVAA